MLLIESLRPKPANIPKDVRPKPFGERHYVVLLVEDWLHDLFHIKEKA
jgi:hypothetical protein